MIFITSHDFIIFRDFWLIAITRALEKMHFWNARILWNNGQYNEQVHTQIRIKPSFSNFSLPSHALSTIALGTAPRQCFQRETQHRELCDTCERQKARGGHAEEEGWVSPHVLWEPWGPLHFAIPWNTKVARAGCKGVVGDWC